MDQDKINAFNEAREKARKEAADKEAAKQNAKEVASRVTTGSLLGSKASSEVKQAVKASGDKVASEVEKVQGILESGQDSVAQAINNLMLATVLTKDPRLAEAADNVAKLLSSIADAGDKFGKSNLNLLPVANKELAKTISDLAKSVNSKQEKDLTPEFDRVVQALNDLDVQPVVNLPQSEIKLDTKPIVDAVKELQKSIKPTKIDIPKTDFSEVVKGLNAVQRTIGNLSFPVPNYVLPFKDSSGKAVQVQVDGDGKIPVAGSFSVDTSALATSAKQSDGSQKTQIVDSGGEAATVTGGKLDVNATASLAGETLPVSGATEGVAVAIVDGSGDQITSFGGGTQYTEDVAAAADPIGTALNLIRKDTLGAITTTDGDNLAARGTNKGELYVKHVDAIPVTDNGGALTVDGTVSVSGTVTTDGSGVTQPVSNAGLTELAASINSNKVDVNIVSSDVASGGTASADDADFTAGTTLGTPAQGVYESTPTTVTDGDLGTVGITAGRRLKTSATIDTALPAGTNNIGDVDVLSSALPTGASTSAKQDTVIGHLDGVEGLLTTIDADTSNLSVVGGGTEAGAIRVTLANNSTGLVSVDDNGGSLTVDGTVGVSGTVTVDGSGVTQPVSNAGLTELAAAINSSKVDVNIVSSDVATGGTSAADDADFTAGTTPGTPSMGVYESTPTTVTDGDLGTVGITAGRRLKTSATIDAALPAGTNAIGKLAANSGVDIGDVDVLSSALPTGASTSAKQDTIIGHLDGVEGLLTTIDGDTGTIAGAVSGSEMQVDVVTMPSVAVTNAGTFATQVDGNALTALQLIDDTVFADDAAVTLGTSKGNVAAGVAVQTDGTDPTAVSAEGDAAALRTDMQRNLIVNQTHPRFWHVSADYASAQTNTSVKAAPGASLSLYITDISISNGATAGNITLLDGSGGTVLYELYPAINGGAVLTLRSPIKLTANTALCITSTTVTTHSIFVSGYIAP